MKRFILATLLISTVAHTDSSAQTTNELYNLSNQQLSMSSARSAAMAGAFTSLGADQSSMFINPAGLAMYRSSEVSITPSLFLNNNNSRFNGMNSQSVNNTKFALTNLSGVYYSDRGGFALAAGYNRLADFSGVRENYATAQRSSIGQVYVEQLNGIPQSNIQTPPKDIYLPFFNNTPNLWNAIMAYQTGLVDPLSPDKNNNIYTMNGLFNPANGDTQIPFSKLRTSGNIGEFTLSGAYNYNDLFYAGLSMGFQDLSYGEDYDYSELFNSTNSGNLMDMTTRSRLRINGTGFNLKMGITVRPVDWLRVGIAYHSPTWMKISESSYTDFTTYDKRFSKPGFSDTPELVNDYTMRSPSRLLGGLSVSIARRVIISVDYERTWYGDMKYNSDLFAYGYRPPVYASPIDNLPNVSDAYNPVRNYIEVNNIITNYYRPTNSIRIGVEAQPVKGVFLRAGYGYTSSPYNDVKSHIYPEKLSEYGAQTIISGGLGYRSKRFGIDLTYVYRETKNLPTTYYSYIDFKGNLIQPDGFIENMNKLSQILLTLSFKI